MRRRARYCPRFEGLEARTLLTATVTTLATSANPSAVGQAVTFSVSVSPVGGSGTPTGRVTLYDGGAAVAGAALDAYGDASLAVSTLAAATHSLTAVYGGAAAFQGSSASLTQVVGQEATAAALASSLNPAAAGQAVILTVGVAPAVPGTAVPTGTVTLNDGTTVLGSAALDSRGAASFTLASLAAGSHTLTATFLGSAGYGSSSATLTQVVAAQAALPYHLWWTPSRLAQARAWYAAHPSTPAAGDDWNLALAYVLTGNVRYGQAAVTDLMNFTISSKELSGVASDTYRWNDWVPVVYDWCHALLTPSQISTFVARYNSYTDAVIAKSWGGPGMEGNNYYWGYLRNELDWALASQPDNPAKAAGYLEDALVTRWQDGVLPYFAGPAAGGVPPEGSQYGHYLLQYPVMPFTSEGLLGTDLYDRTAFYQAAALDLIYSTSPAPVYQKGNPQPYYQVFPFSDDQYDGGYPAAGAGDPDGQSVWWGDFMTAAAQQWAGTAVGRYARQWLNTVQADRDNYVAAADPGGAALSFSSLPTDYYAPGMGFLYTRDQWGPQGTSVLLQLGQAELAGTDNTTVGHWHDDEGTFQVVRGDEYVTKESTGYAQTFNGEDSGSTQAHNGLLVGGLGQADLHQAGPARVLRLQSAAAFSYAAVDLTAAYQSTDPTYNDPAVAKVIREFIFVKPLGTLVVLDRVQTTDPNAPVTFLLHVPQAPQVTGPNSVLAVNGDQALKLTTLNPSGVAYNVVNENGGEGYQASYYNYRVEASTSGSTQYNLINVVQARSAGAADVRATLTQGATSWTVSLVDPATGAQAQIVLQPGMASAGGAVGYSAAGAPTALTPLLDHVQSIAVTPNGPAWGI